MTQKKYTHINSIRKERETTTIDSTDIKGIVTIRY